MTALEFRESQRFEGAPRQIATRCAHAPGEIVGNLNGEFHALLRYRTEGTQSTGTSARTTDLIRTLPCGERCACCPPIFVRHRLHRRRGSRRRESASGLYSHAASCSRQDADFRPGREFWEAAARLHRTASP